MAGSTVADKVAHRSRQRSGSGGYAMNRPHATHERAHQDRSSRQYE